MKNWTKFFLITLLMMLSNSGFGQELITVSGTVNDEFGHAPDVQVTALKSGNSTTTDEAGFYEIQVAPDDTLEFTSVMGVTQTCLLYTSPSPRD